MSRLGWKVWPSPEALLLQPMRRLAVDEDARPNFGVPDGGLMELAQLPASRRRRLPSRDELRSSEFSSAQRPAISGEVPGRQPDGAPAAGSVRSDMHTLIRAECDDL